MEIRVPRGARIAPAAAGGFGQQYQDALLAGLYVGGVYRFHVTDIPEHPGVEIFPTVELIDRLYPPSGKFLKFPVPVDLTRDELLMAAEGRFITRVIYVEDPKLALPVAEATLQGEPWLEVGPGQDPLVAADGLGRPIAILRMGGRVPTGHGVDPSFSYGTAPAMIYDQPPTEMPAHAPSGAMQMPLPLEALPHEITVPPGPTIN